MLSFLFVDKRKLSAMKLSFEEFNLVLHVGSERLAGFEQTKAARFLKTLYIPYSMIKEKYVFKREFLYL